MIGGGGKRLDELVEQILDDGFAGLDMLFDGPQIIDPVRARRFAAQQQLGIAEDKPERVLDLMCHTGRQLAQRRHPIGLQALPMHQLALRNVLDDPLKFGNAAGRTAADAHAEEGGQFPARAGPQDALPVLDETGAPDIGKQLPGMVGADDERGQCLLGHEILAGIISQHPDTGRVDVQQAAVMVGHENQIHRVFKDPPVFGFRFGQNVFGGRQLLDIAFDGRRQGVKGFQ